jgi:parvulin-like peptidyl-prolyl isomerase
MKRAGPMHGMAVFVAAALLPLAAACSGSAPPGKAASAVKINDEEVPYSDFEAYLKASLGEEVPPAKDGETRSHLLDQFIGERLLLQRAQSEHLQVGDEQVNSYLAGLGGAPAAPKAAEEPAMKEQVRRNLLVQEYKDRVLLKNVKVDPAEVEDYFRAHPQEFQQSRGVVLRQILLDDPAEAKRLEAELKEDPAKFPVLAQRESLSPDKGQPRQFEEGDLPDAVKQAVLSLSPGEVSGQVGDGDKIRIFQMVDKRDGKSLSLDEARRRIEVLLLQHKAEDALRQALEGIRASATIRVHRENLPFAYQGEYGG